jgi:hypothetical protein
MIEVRTIVSHWDHDHEVTKLTVEIFPLPNDAEIHAAVAKAITDLLARAFEATIALYPPKH